MNKPNGRSIMNSQFYMWEGDLSEEQVNSIITECEYYKLEEAAVGYGPEGKPNTTVRSSEVRWINQEDPNSRFIANLVWNYTLQANRYAFGVDMRQIGDIQYTTYNAENEGHYDWHIDTFIGNSSASDRKLSVTIQLSDSDDYEGGDFILDTEQKPPKESLRKKGTVLVFPSFMRHKVEPVTKGIRKSLVAWIEGPHWK